MKPEKVITYLYMHLGLVQLNRHA